MTMELRKFLREGMSFVLLFILGNVSSVTPFPGSENKAGIDFECSNDYKHLMFCQLRPRSDQQDCTEYSLNLTLSDPPQEHAITEHCIFERKEGECSCSMRMDLILAETHTATLWKAGEQLKSKAISVTDTIKPNPPTITSVKELNGNFQVKWDTNYEKNHFETMGARVTYRKKGEKEEVAKDVTSVPYEINGRHLDPSTKYLVRVENYAYRYSDSSEEWEFTTPATSYITLAVIISLSFAGVIITSVVFGCYVRFKAKWWDKVATYPDSTLLNMLPGKKMLLGSSQTTFSPVYVVPPEPNDGKPWSKCSLSDTSSGINTGSSSLSYANTLPADIVVIEDMDAIDASIQKALRKALPQMSSVTDSSLKESNKNNSLLSADYNPCRFRNDECNRSPGSSSFDNKTYAILIPSHQKQLMVGSSAIQMQPVLCCDPAYHPTEGDVLRSTCPDQLVPTCLVTRQQDADMSLFVSSSVQTDLSYQPCNADSGSFSSAEDTSLCSVTSGINTSAPCHHVSSVEAGCESLDQAVSGARNPPEVTQDANPCYGSLPAPLQSLPPADGNYQAFQSLVKQPNNLLPEQSSGELGEHLDKYPEEFCSGGLEFGIPQDSMGPVLPDFRFNGGCLPELESPFLSVLLTHNSEPVITDSSYHSV